MNVLKLTLLGLTACFVLFACSKDDTPSTQYVINGTISKNDSTFIEVGSHVIQDFGIESKTLDLDEYLNQTVTIYGDPIDNNEKHIEVIEVRQ